MHSPWWIPISRRPCRLWPIWPSSRGTPQFAQAEGYSARPWYPRTYASAGRPAIGHGLFRSRQRSSNGRPHGGAETRRRAHAQHARVLGAGHPQVSRDLANLAFAVRAAGRLSEAEGLYREALASFERSTGATHPDYATMLNNLSRIRASQGDWKTAQRLQEKALATLERSLGPDHPTVAAALVNVADLLFMAKRYDRAAAPLERALAIDEARLGAEHPRTANDLDRLGEIALRRKQHRAASEYLTRALALNRRLHGPESAEAAQSAMHLAETYRTMGRIDEATGLFRESLAVLEKAWGKDDRRLLGLLGNYEKALRAMEDYTGAAKLEAWSARIRVRHALAADSGGSRDRS